MDDPQILCDQIHKSCIVQCLFCLFLELTLVALSSPSANYAKTRKYGLPGFTLNKFSTISSSYKRPSSSQRAVNVAVIMIGSGKVGRANL
ncbi:hypothetical protein VM1G_03470 [Cytospora mali]|uniref:Uncharacterized protein n=1 Tax=Cytospora mali TaxID=578113 RepID=A0A194VUZ1_CYTMA|nr:hypothetical protein VM1G_03470 [Valsa mali]